MLMGEVPARRFVLRVRGGPQVAHPRASALSRSLRDTASPNGWRALSGVSTNGHQVPLYVSPDKNGQQVRCELQTRKLAKILGEMVGQGVAIRGQRTRGIVTADAAPLARLVVGETPTEDTRIQWHPPALARLALDRDDVARRFREATASHLANTEWL